MTMEGLSEASEGLNDEELQNAILQALEEEHRISHTQHSCPDLSEFLPSLATTFVPLFKGYFALDDEGQGTFSSFCETIRVTLSDLLPLSLFADQNQKSFMIHIWSGRIANAVANAF